VNVFTPPDLTFVFPRSADAEFGGRPPSFVWLVSADESLSDRAQSFFRALPLARYGDKIQLVNRSGVRLEATLWHPLGQLR
jgi:hypothetical protein